MENNKHLPKVIMNKIRTSVLKKQNESSSSRNIMEELFKSQKLIATDRIEIQKNQHKKNLRHGTMVSLDQDNSNVAKQNVGIKNVKNRQNQKTQNVFKRLSSPKKFDENDYKNDLQFSFSPRLCKNSLKILRSKEKDNNLLIQSSKSNQFTSQNDIKMNNQVKTKTYTNKKDSQELIKKLYKEVLKIKQKANIQTQYFNLKQFAYILYQLNFIKYEAYQSICLESQQKNSYQHECNLIKKGFIILKINSSEDIITQTNLLLFLLIICGLPSNIEILQKLFQSSEKQTLFFSKNKNKNTNKQATLINISESEKYKINKQFKSFLFNSLSNPKTNNNNRIMKTEEEELEEQQLRMSNKSKQFAKIKREKIEKQIKERTGRQEITLYDILTFEKDKQKIQQAREEKQKRLKQICTFQPKELQYRQNHEAVFDQLYSKGLQTIYQKKYYIKEQETYPFIPDISESQNSLLYLKQQQPLSSSCLAHIQRRKKAEKQKMITAKLLQQGTTFNKKLEQKILQQFPQVVVVDNNTFQQSQNSVQKPLLCVQVTFGNQTANIYVYKNDKAEVLAQQFIQKYHLKNQKKEKLIQLLKEKMKNMLNKIEQQDMQESSINEY